MAKRSKRRKEAPLTKKQIARSRRIQRQERWVRFGLAAVAVLVLIVLAVGLYQEYIAKPAAPVAIVNGVTIRTDEYQKRVRYERFRLDSYEAQIQQQLSQLDPNDASSEWLSQYLQQSLEQVQSQRVSLPQDVVQQMIDEELIRQEAARRGITVSASEVQQAIEEWFGFQRNPPTPTPTPITATETITVTPTPTTPPMTEAQFREEYARYLRILAERVGFSEQDLRRIFENRLLEQKLREAMAQEVESVVEQVHARHILVETREEAEEVRQRLLNGEDFATLAQELSQDPGSKDEGGDLGWFPRGVMVAEFEEAAFSLPVGQISDVVETDYGYHIIEVLEREMRELDPSILQRRQEARFEEWLEEQRESDGVENMWTADKVPPEEEIGP